MANDKNGVSTLFWVIAIVLSRLPCIGFLISILFVIFCENESKKNFFKASLLIDIAVIFLIILIPVLPFSPLLLDMAKHAVDHLPQYFKGN